MCKFLLLGYDVVQRCYDICRIGRAAASATVVVDVQEGDSAAAAALLCCPRS